MRIVACVLVLVCSAALAGCGLFRGQSNADSKQPLLGSAKNQQQKPSATENSPPDDPLFKTDPLSTSLSGQVVDSTNMPLENAYVRKTCLDETGPKEAPIDIAVQPKGYFTIPAKQGKRYKLEARAKMGNKLIADSVQAVAPQNTLHLVLKEENVLPDTPALPPPPGLPLKPKTTPPEADGGKQKAANAQAGGVGWAPGTGGKTPKSGLTIGPPVPMGDAPDNGTQGGWGSAPNSNNPPKYPPNIAAGPSDPFKPPAVKINPPASGSASSSDAAGVDQKPKGTAHVPSCVLIGNRLSNFALPDFYGNAWEWKANRLGKVVLLDFWRTNCPPCLASMSHLRQIQAQYGPAGLEIIGIAHENHGTVEEQRLNVIRKCQLKDTNYRILLATGDNDPVVNSFSIRVLPTLVLLDEQGNILWQHEGGLDASGWQALEQLIQTKLGK